MGVCSRRIRTQEPFLCISVRWLGAVQYRIPRLKWSPDYDVKLFRLGYVGEGGCKRRGGTNSNAQLTRHPGLRFVRQSEANQTAQQLDRSSIWGRNRCEVGIVVQEIFLVPEEGVD